MKIIKTNWISIFIFFLGIYNIISGLVSIPFKGFIFQILTKSIVIFSGFSSLLTGFVLTLIGYGLYRMMRLALRIALILLIISISINLFMDVNLIGVMLSGILLVLLYRKRREFTKLTGVSLDVRYLMALWIVIFVLLYGIAGAYFLGQQFNPPISTLIQALYYTVITSTTVGYGDFVPVTDQARLFAVSLIFLGVGTFLSAVVLIIQPIMKELEKNVEKWTKVRKE